MFHFGNPEEIAESYIADALRKPGPPMAEGELEELAPQDLGIAYIYMRMALDRALHYDDAPDEVIEILEEKHDELFCHLVARHYEFRENFRIGNHSPVRLVSKEVRDHYKALFAQYDPSAN